MAEGLIPLKDGSVPLKLQGYGQTRRSDAWWTQPLAVFLGLFAFLVYANLRVFEGAHYHYDANGAHYLTPFYSPLMFDTPGTVSGHAWMSSKPAWLPGFVSAAALILIFPAGFRFTCYYYRGAYYKAFWGSPPSCAVGKFQKNYRGEEKLPLIIQNIHRYFLYAALVFWLILCYDAVKAFRFHNADGSWGFGMGVGTIVLVLNAVFLGGYTFGCHSLRHLVGGCMDEVSKSPLRKKCYDGVSCLNGSHMAWAWVSLIWVAFTDLYIRYCSMGVWNDVRFF